MTHIGIGVSYSAFPENLGGSSIAPFPDETIVETKGGSIEIKWSAPNGDARLARGLYINGRSGTIEGGEFDRRVQSVVTPLIVARGG